MKSSYIECNTVAPLRLYRHKRRSKREHVTPSKAESAPALDRAYAANSVTLFLSTADARRINTRMGRLALCEFESSTKYCNCMIYANSSVW